MSVYIFRVSVSEVGMLLGYTADSTGGGHQIHRMVEESLTSSSLYYQNPKMDARYTSKLP
jgi:hypothetical protein